MLAANWHVKHIMAAGKTTDADITKGAIVADNAITYLGEQGELEL
jgi:hypothetical protein